MPEPDDEVFEAQGAARASCRSGFRRSCAHRPSVLAEEMGLFRIGLQMQHFANLDALAARHDDADVAAQFGAGVNEGFGAHGLDEFGLGRDGALAGAAFGA